MKYEFTGKLRQALYFTGNWEEFEIKSQPEFMITHGLVPDHYFLDLACGCLRGTVPLVEYMKVGHFYGADISFGLLKMAFERVHQFGSKKLPLLHLIEDYEFGRLFNRKFDFILSVSLLTHLLPDIIPALFYGVREILKPGGVWYFTMYPTDKDRFDGNIELARYNKNWLIDQGNQNGLFIKDIDEGIRPNPCPDPGKVIQEVNSTLGQWVMYAKKL